MTPSPKEEMGFFETTHKHFGIFCKLTHLISVTEKGGA
jgi:hypothetical protein